MVLILAYMQMMDRIQNRLLINISDILKIDASTVVDQAMSLKYYLFLFLHYIFHSFNNVG